jgi:DNA-binding CsgD family transcriptional regulator
MRAWTGRRSRWLLGLVAVTTFTILVVEELVLDDERLTLATVLFELFDMGLPIGCTVTSALLVLRSQAQEEESRVLRGDLEVLQAEERRWREDMADHLQALGDGIRRQFESWQLTAAEQDVGLLLLKGFSHKEIARVRGTSEATVRQQAAALYQKAGLSGRTALSAFLLEDLLSGRWMMAWYRALRITHGLDEPAAHLTATRRACL